MERSTINEKIAKDFLTDSRDFLKRYKLLEEKSISGHIGMRSKLLIELLFSAECSIKALIFLESNNDEQVTYQKIIEHDLSKLLGKLSSSGKSACSAYIDKKLFNFKVENRYMLEAYKRFSTSGGLDEEYYSTIANHDWFHSVYKQLDKLDKYVWSKIKVPVESLNFTELCPDKIIVEHNKIMNLKKK